jgi:hypothetical protein
MKGWALHHIHLVIVIDALMHVIMAGLIGFCWILFARLARLTQKVKATRIPLCCMAAILGYVSWLTVSICLDCFRQYAAWWSR